MMASKKLFLMQLKKDYDNIEWTGDKSKPSLNFKFRLSKIKQEETDKDNKGHKIYCLELNEERENATKKLNEFELEFNHKNPSYVYPEDDSSLYLIVDVQQNQN
jgi:hypothetical protein